MLCGDVARRATSIKSCIEPGSNNVDLTFAKAMRALSDICSCCYLYDAMLCRNRDAVRGKTSTICTKSIQDDRGIVTTFFVLRSMSVVSIVPLYKWIEGHMSDPTIAVVAHISTPRALARSAIMPITLDHSTSQRKSYLTAGARRSHIDHRRPSSIVNINIMYNSVASATSPAIKRAYSKILHSFQP